MARGWFGVQIPARLRTWPTADELARMVRHPAAFAPTAAEVLTPEPVEQPFADTAELLAAVGARDIVTVGNVAVGVSLTGRAFVAFAEELFARLPLHEVQFVAVRHLLGELVRCPFLTRLSRIGLAGNRIGPAGATLVAGCEHLSELHELDLTNNSIGDDGLRAISVAPWADSIRLLHLGGNGLTPAGERAAECRFGNRLLLT